MNPEHDKRQKKVFIFEGRVSDSRQTEDQIRLASKKTRQKLLYCNILTIWNNLMMIITGVKLSWSFDLPHKSILFFMLMFLFALSAILIFAAWNKISYRVEPFKEAHITYLDYQLKNVTGQRTLVVQYVFSHLGILVTICIFFFMDSAGQAAKLLMLKLIAPGGIITYLAGLYFIWSFTNQKKDLEISIKNRQVSAEL